jgi:hypothetical protein
MKEKPITIYLTNAISVDTSEKDWSFLYPRPKNMFSNLLQDKSEVANKESFFACPAFSDLTKKTLQYLSPMNASYVYDFTSKDHKYFRPTSPQFVNANIIRPPALAFGNTVQFELMYMMFADEPLDVLFTSPHFSKPGYTRFGTAIPGQYDVGKWFRPYAFEVQLWSDQGEFHLRKDEPLFYAHLQTDRDVVFKYFNMSDRLSKMAQACVATTNMFGRGQTLLSRYERFKSIGMRSRILAEINKNIIE